MSKKAKPEKMHRQSKGIATTIFLVILAIITLFPFYLMIMMSTHTGQELFTELPLLPGDALVDNFKEVAGSSFFKFYRNSLIASTTATIIGTLTSAMGGFALAKYQFKGKKLITRLILMTMMIPGQISLIAYVMEMRSMGLTNSLLPVIIPFTYSSFGVYWMMQSISSSLPDAVLESARIDGAGELRIFFKIVLPQIMPAIVTIALLLFLWSWNSYLVPLITISNMENYTVPLGIAMLNGMYRTNYAAKILALSLGTIPLVVLFAFGSKYFIRGLTAGSVKG